MNTPILLVVGLLLAGSGYFLYINVPEPAHVPPEQPWPTQEEPNEAPQDATVNETEEDEDADSVTGTITHVDAEAAMIDGPVLITITTDAGASRVIAVPSMGLRLCAAVDTITDPFALKAGTKVAVRGEVGEGGQLVPCSDSSHYLRIVAD